MYAFITGASSGIGKELSILLAQRGYDLILVARRKDRLKKLKDSLETRYRCNVILKATDISKEENCLALIEDLNQYPIEVMINNAGFGKVGYVTEQDLSDNLDMIKTNLIAPHIFTSWFCRHAKHGYVLNVSSIAAFTTPPLFSVYGATKSYLYHFSTALNYEMKRQKKPISITTLCPGSVKTEFYKDGGKQSNICILSARTCAELALDGLYKKKALIVPTFSMKATYLFCKFMPKVLMLPMQYFLQKSKINS
ncbi:SDR family NAD(P)-dependent oxidoreductase [[Clostridium] polysaccharolyticum]|uniref:Short-chain dehydrogenase n=1 Tax=[Clostridium] polysaccharolyticum TaxID=29364 RepID=A0A1I0FLB2_9FIRM|nr:SDR family NAD(P)-dependent oxidoreductase [[Clostridium] polysaccharolyticum]SET59099.1 hypothetical protein SAMN04487772_13318 [[Clostridium] polysaccharolyticum]